MYVYNKERLIVLLGDLLKKNIPESGWNWLREKTLMLTSGHLFTAFMTAPRFTGKSLLTPGKEELKEIHDIRNGFTVSGFTADRLARIWLLLHLPHEDKTAYLKTIHPLFQSAEMNELAALYSALPVLAYPEDWTPRCVEGIRSNIGIVLEAIMYNNPYPSEYLDQPAWNQMVLKAFFTEKKVYLIHALDQRANQALAYMLSDYAHERWAAHRTVNPQLWRLLGKFLDERTFPDIQKLFDLGDEREKLSAALACAQSEYGPAKVLLHKMPHLESAIKDNKLTWEILANDP
ncbi:MAG: EboA domain-containing protein [Chitinophagaceae bacterium]